MTDLKIIIKLHKEAKLWLEEDTLTNMKIKDFQMSKS